MVLSLPWGGVPPARGQEAVGAGIAENIAAGRSATDFHSRLRVNSAYLSVDRPDDPWLVSTRFSGTYAPHPSVALRLQLPLVYVELDPGSALFFHSNLLHRSDANQSDDPRWTLICCYNAARNEPYRESQHPSYRPLEKLDDGQVKIVGKRQLQQLQQRA